MNSRQMSRTIALILLMGLWAPFSNGEIVRIRGDGGGSGGSTTFDGFSFEAFIDNYQNPVKQISRLLKFNAEFKRPRGSFGNDFNLSNLDVIRFSTGIIRHPSTQGDGYPAYIISLIRKDLGEDSAIHPRTGGEVINNLIGRIIIYPSQDEIRFVENYEDGNDFDDFRKIKPEKVIAPSFSHDEGLLAAELSRDDPLTLVRCVEWVEWMGRPGNRKPFRRSRKW